MEELQSFVTVFVKLPESFDEELKQYMKKVKVITGEKQNKASIIVKLARIGLKSEKI
jgi:hypothetical protein